MSYGGESIVNVTKAVSLFYFVVYLLYFDFVAFDSSVAIIYPRFDQSSVGGLDDLDGVLCVQRGLKFKPEQGRDLHSGDKTRVFVVFV